MLIAGITLLVCLSLTQAAPDSGSNQIADIQYQNQYDQPLSAYCHGGGGMYRVYSVFSAPHRDRVFSWQCKTLQWHGNTQCADTDYVNNFDDPLYFMCGRDQYIAGVYSYHDNGFEDRRWRFRCCSTRGVRIFNCRLTGYVNNFNQPIHFEASRGEVITGVYSYHKNGREDRRMGFQVCRYR